MSLKNLSNQISKTLEEISRLFGEAQKINGLTCPNGCGKCCFKTDIYCAPYELLPMALYLTETNRATSFLEKAELHKNDRCVLFQVDHEEKGLGHCTEYRHRPFICRVFGVSARKDKYSVYDYSICKMIKERHGDSVNILQGVPLMAEWKKKLEALDPHLLEKEIPINQALGVILEKILLLEKFSN